MSFLVSVRMSEENRFITVKELKDAVDSENYRSDDEMETPPPRKPHSSTKEKVTPTVCL